MMARHIVFAARKQNLTSISDILMHPYSKQGVLFEAVKSSGKDAKLYWCSVLIRWLGDCAYFISLVQKGNI